MTPKLVRPDSVPAELWEALNDEQKYWIIRHELMHDVKRRIQRHVHQNLNQEEK